MHTTKFLSVKDARELIRKVGLYSFTEKVVDRLESNFSNWQDFDKSPRTANHSEVGVIELMPVSNDHQFSFKYVNGHPQNPSFGLSTVMAFGCLSEVQTGWPLLLSEMTILTGIRTAATSVMVAKKLARKNSKTMAMIGNGAQSEFQILAFHSILGINRVHLFDTDPEATKKLVRNLAHVDGLELVTFESTRDAVKGCDIVTTCTADKALATILTADMVEEGMHINGIGGDCPGKTELDKDILSKSSVFVEYAPQSRIEGDIQQMPADFPVTEFWEVLTGVKAGRTSDSQVTVFDSVGFSLEDFSVLQVAYQLMEEHNMDTSIEIVPIMEDSKDLFGLLNLVPSIAR